MKRSSLILAIGLLAACLSLSLGQAAETMPGKPDAAIRATASEYIAAHKIKVTWGQEPFDPSSLEVTPLGAKWHRVRFTLADSKNPHLKILVIHEDGRTIDPSHDWDQVVTARKDIAGDAKDDAGYSNHAKLYLQMFRPESIAIIRDVKDIAKYDVHPLAPDLAAAVRAPWSQKSDDRVEYVCYTYQQVGGMVERWQFTFRGGQIVSVNTLRFPGNVGEAIFYE